MENVVCPSDVTLKGPNTVATSRTTSKRTVRAANRRGVLVGVALVGLLFLGGCARTIAVTGSGEDPTKNGTQSETAATSARSGDRDSFVVTYNDDTDDGKIKYTPTDRIVYPGASLLGWSYSVDRGKTWKYGGKVAPPPGIAALWGDPAIVTSGTSYNRVYISSLAIGEGKIPADGHHSWLDDGSITGACVARSDDGGVHFKIQSCFSADGDFYDGGSMAAAAPGFFTGGDQRVFAAYVDVPHNRIDVWASSDGIAPFQRLPDPFPGMPMLSHPKLAYDRSTGALLVAAIAYPSNNGLIYMNRLVGSSWQRPVQVSNATSRIDVSVGSETIRMAYGFSFDVGAPSQSERDDTLTPNDDEIRLLYTTRDAETKRLYVRGSACRYDLAHCRDVPQWGTTPGNLNTPGQQWNPTVKAWPGFIGLPPVWKATYQTTDDTPKGVSIKEGNLAVFPNGTPVFLPFAVVPPRPVCPDYRNGSPGAAVGGYWGDYDESAMVGFAEGSTSPQFLLAFSDSSKGCVQQYKFTSNHLHVSSVLIR
jgi:hypothetical protein